MYKGMYCAMCDSTKHEFFNFQKEEIYISEQTCRTQVEFTVQILAYFDFLLDDYNNVLSQFLYSCDYKGKYEYKLVPKKLSFKSNVEKEYDLR